MPNATLIILGGLPGSGKTTVARELARQIEAVHVRIDSIEQALRSSGLLAGPVDDAGYRVGHVIAEDNLRLGRAVVADSVNPLEISRSGWRDVARGIPVPFLEVELICSNPSQHRHRVETRISDVDGLKQPTWDEVLQREYEPWRGEHLVIDTTTNSVAQVVALILGGLAK
jgi:predicted kinase